MAKVLTTIPAAFATDVFRNVFLTAQVDVDLDRATVTELTVLLVKSSDRTIVDGVADYVLGTRTVTFQLKELLEEETEYTWILVGRSEGIKTLDGQPAFSSNEQITFTTGNEDKIDPNIPLATNTIINQGDIPAFQGGQGINTVIFGATGEPVTFAVTTAGQVGPSGLIVPAPAGSAVYLAASGTLGVEDAIAISGATDPADGDSFLNIQNLTDISIWFSDIPITSGLVNGGIDIVVEDILGLDATQPIFTTSVTGNRLDVALDAWRGASVYNITVSKDIDGVNTKKLGENFQFSFTTKPRTFFTTVKMVRINLGSAISKISDDDIRLLIYENSLWAFEHHPSGFDVLDPPQYVKDFVLCKTKLDALNTALMGAQTPVAKKIGEVEFRYGTNINDRFKTKIDEIKDCVEDNRKIILSGGAKTTMVTATKARFFGGRPGTSSTWKRIGKRGEFANLRNAPVHGVNSQDSSV